MMTHMNPSGPAIIGNSAVVVPAAQRIIYVHHNLPSLSDLESAYVQNYAVTVQAALSSVRTGRGDIIQLLSGHAETISGADGWSNLGAATGVTILGPPTGPPATITWSATASSLLMDAADFVIDGLRPGGIEFEFAGDPTLTAALTVTAPITISAARCALRNIRARCAVDADQLATIPITTTADADYLHLTGLDLYGAITGECTTFLRLVGGSHLRMYGCHMYGATSSTTVGVLQMLTTAPDDVHIKSCDFSNRKAASIHAATGIAAATGMVEDCSFGILDNTTLAGWETEGDIQFVGCRTSNLAGEEGAVKTPTSA